MVRMVLLLAWLVAAAGTASAQEASLSQDGPRFLLAAGPGGRTVEIAAAAAPIFQRRVTLALEHATVGEALTAIGRQAGIALVYSRDVLDPDVSMRIKAEGITVAAALTEILLGAGVDVVLSDVNRATLAPRKLPAPRAAGAIVGRVTDAKTGEGLAGADVALEGTRSRTAAGEDGRYRLADVAPGSYTLAVRRIGYAKRGQPVAVADGQETTADVALEPVPTQLDEVVSTVTGDQRLRELGHVVGRINADSLVREAPVSNLTELLQSRVPGLLVQPQQGTVGGEVKLQIRSTNSISLSSEPIVLVDGIRYTTNPRAGPNAAGFGYILGPFGGNEGTSRLNDLNPNDIESIEVVKGPSAATLYGTDAANGVIVITTKRGRPGPARWNAYGRATRSEIPARRYRDSYWGWGTETSTCFLRGVASGDCVQDSVTVIPNPLNDPALTIFSSKPRWEYGANVAGGGQDLRYYFSADFEDATGPVQLPASMIDQVKARRGVGELPKELLEPNAFTNLNLRTTVSANLGRRAELRTTVGYTQRASRTLVSANPFRGASGGDPTDPFSRGWNPIDAFAQTSTERINRFFGSATGEWRPTAWLQARGTVGLDLTNSNRYSLVRPGEAPNSYYADGVVGDDRTRYLASSADLGATASFRAGRLTSRTSTGAQYVRTLFDGLTSNGRGLPPGGSSIGDAASVSTDQDYHERVTLGGYVEQMFGLNDRLFLTGALRMDGGSGFGRDYNAAFYPKAGLSWIASEEPFFPRIPGLDELRLRYSYGASGQQPWSVWTNPDFYATTPLADGTIGNGIHQGSFGNPDLRPERVREHEFGLDAAALNGRARLDLSWNYRTTLDQLTLVEQSPGFGYITTNLGRTTGHGVEAQLTLRPVDSRLVTWDIAINHAWHISKLADLGSGVPNLRTDGGYAEGYPLDGRFSFPLLGYSDANGNGIIERTEVQLGDSMVYVGQMSPPRTQTLSTTVGLFQQRLRLSALLDRQSGFLVADPQMADCLYNRRCRAAVDPSAPLGDQAQVAAMEAAGNFLRYSPMASGDFTRLREVTVALDLPEGLVRAARLGRASLSVSVRNLALWTSFHDADPESSAIPQARAWAFRLDIGL
jgi:TonB-linked SusC/RagA family outer membrane protein